jgi:hypothetical protein
MMTYMGTRARPWSMDPECWCFSGRSISRGASLSMAGIAVVAMSNVVCKCVCVFYAWWWEGSKAGRNVMVAGMR